MNKRALIVSSLLITAELIVFLAGCRTPTSSIRVESYPRNNIVVNSKMLDGYLEVAQINATTNHGLLQAQIRAQNLTQRDLQMEYRFRWMDAKGMEIDTRSTLWTQVAVNAKDIIQMQGIAPSREVLDYIFDVRYRRPATRWE